MTPPTRRQVRVIKMPPEQSSAGAAERLPLARDGHGLPKYLQVEQRLHDAIRQRLIGDKLPGERVLAREFGVSYMTLRRAIDNLVAADVLFRVPQLGTFVRHPGSAEGSPDIEADADLNADLNAGRSSGQDLIRRLRAENRELREANELLRRAAIYLAEADRKQPA